MAHRSTRDVSRSRPMHMIRLGVLVLSGAVGLTGAARPVQAAGCHVQDRPVLGYPLSWERDQEEVRASRASSVRQVPPLLRSAPCQGEVPKPPGSPSIV